MINDGNKWGISAVAWWKKVIVPQLIYAPKSGSCPDEISGLASEI
jgi:hypothetical protein